MNPRPHFLRVLFVVFPVLAGITPISAGNLPAKESFHVFLLMGQSNMAGRGALEPEDKQPHPHVLMLNQMGEWVPAIDPMHFDKPVAGVGLGRTFGLAIAAARPGVTVGLVPCAVGGSPIDVWRPGVRYEPTQSHPWDDALRRAKLALRAGTLQGILWHQGESDAKPALAADYEAKLHALIARLRTELNAPTAPFIVGQLGVFPEAPWDAARIQVDRAHRELPAKIPHTGFVSAAGLTHKGDRVHFDSRSYRILGRRYAEAFLELTKNRP